MKTELIFRDPMENTGYQQEESAVSALSFAVNCGSFNSRQMAEELAATANNKIKLKNLKSLIAVCCIAHGYSWECDERKNASPHWDERNKASQEYCNKYLNIFKQMFEDATGEKILFREPNNYEGFLRDLAIKKPSEVRIYREAGVFLKEHHTLQQSMIRVFIKTLYNLNIMPEITAEVSFPYI